MYVSLLKCNKCVHGIELHKLKRYFQIKQQGRNRRTRRCCEFDVEIPRIHTNVGRKAFAYYGPVTWNSLLRDLKETVNVNSFKSKLKKADIIFDNHPT